MRSSDFELSVHALQRIISTKAAKNGLILGLLWFVFAVRLYKLTSVPLGLDEIITIARYAPLSIIDIFKTHYSNNHPIASLLAHAFSPQANHLFMMRWPSVIIGMLSLPFVYGLSATVFGRKVAILALLLVGTSPVHIGYSVIIRGYIGLILLTIVSLYFLWRALRGNRWLDWSGFFIANILVIYFHLFGVVAMAIQVGLVTLWFLRGLNHARHEHISFDKWRLKPSFAKFGWITLLLLIVYPLLIYAQTSSILSSERWPSDFDVWGDGTFSWSQDLSPFTTFASLMAPISSKGIGAYIYLFFWTVGLAYVWHLRRILALGILLWFLAPFVAIFAAVQILGSTFYAYVRFLLYLLPVYLILVAVGLNACLAWLASLTPGRSWPWRVIIYIASSLFVVGFLSLVTISVKWYILRSTHTDWPDAAKVLSRELQPSDITICEEHRRGFVLPDRAKPYCTWMLDFFVPELEGYTPHFQSSTDFIANYDYLQEQRTAMLQPGTVWLVIWQKIIFHPGELITDQKPPVEPPPPLSMLEPYEAYHFGSATLVHINAEDTLLGNVSKTLELLLKVEASPADRARYYRSLAELEAVQGHAFQANEFLEESWAMVEQAGGNPVSFLSGTQQAIDRIPDNRLPPAQATSVSYKFGQSLCLRAYEISPTVESGFPLALTLYWQTNDFVNEDYTFFIHLSDEAGQTNGRLEFQPFDRIYPTPWWWVDQRIVETRQFPLPPDLLKQNYLVSIGAYDKRASDNEIVRPLFSMSFQADETGPALWKLEQISFMPADCP